MPQDVYFAIPFRARLSEYLEPARNEHVEWVRSRGLTRSEEGLDEYLAWDLSQMVARNYPDADYDDTVLLMNWFAVSFLLDDQFADLDEGPAGGGRLRAARVAEVCREMIAVPYRPAGAPTEVDCPITAAWAEVWAGLGAGMSETWADRFGSSWGRFMAAHAYEVRRAAEHRGPEMGLDEYRALRRQTVGMFHALDVAERSVHCELPPQVAAHEVMRGMRRCATDTIAYMNDIHSLEREEHRGDAHNLVVVLRREHRLAREDALAEAIRMARAELDEYLRLEERLPKVCAELGLDGDERGAVEVGVEGIRSWIRGNHDWARSTGRYASGGTHLGTGEDLLTAV
jgi:germacradienol/geosmin synthase